VVPGTGDGVDPTSGRSQTRDDRDTRSKQSVWCTMKPHRRRQFGGGSSRRHESRRSIRRYCVDAITSLAATINRHDEWVCDVTVSGSQKGMMLAPGWGSNAISDKACCPQPRPRFPGHTGIGNPILDKTCTEFLPYTPATNLLYGLPRACKCCAKKVEDVFARHRRHGEATRVPVRAWALRTWLSIRKN